MKSSLKSVIHFVILSSTATLSLSALAGDAVNQQLSVTENPSVKVKVQRGQLQFIAWDQASIKVEGNLDDLSQGLTLEQQGNHFVIEDKMPRNYNGNNKQGSNLTIYLPAKIMLDNEGVSTDVSIANFTGEIKIAQVSGNLSLNHLSGDIQANTVSGDITSKNLSGKLTFESVSGDIDDQQSEGQSTLRMVSGDIDIQAGQYSQVSIEQVSGEIKAELMTIEELKLTAISGDTELMVAHSLKDATLESISGNLAITFMTMPDAQFNIDGGPGGKIRNNLTQDKPLKPKYSPGASLTFATQAGHGRININTISGTIELASK
ncbi:DUF4097 family beta strand repeat-containing protein [Shewanella aestuarii]|uniref:DUF4097 domain-containing protein n=1 Tax=Shewanella aestuarii TaxID=1028752 RepID=A0A6G9QM19_9GAMM|nr:DUF4097 family beta strand repeat-containing protein [Shewanella aestuarii]QIR15438.1 DUF4097 domain-containing protein [Shewanella aestuarii]